MKKALIFSLIPLTVIVLYYPAIFTFFSQDDFFHFKVGLTDGSLGQFINLFGFHSFDERGIAFYRPIFREGIFNIFYSVFGLNPYPFRILQFLLLFINSALVYYLMNLLFYDRRLSFFVAFFYAISSAQVAPLYYLAGGIQVLGATTFLLLTLILILKNSFFSFITFLFALGSHELASVIPLLVTGLLFVSFSFKRTLKKLWQLLPFFSVLFIYLYLEITKIGFSIAEQQYNMVFNIKATLNSYMWYAGWAMGLPEMLIDFVLPGFQLNPNLMKYWGNYYIIIFSAFFISLLLLVFGVFYLLYKKRGIFNKVFFFFLFWFLIGLFPIILLPLHKSTQYLETSLAAFWTLIGLIILNVYRSSKSKIYLIILVFCLITLSSTSAILQRTTYWAAERGKYAQQLIKQVTIAYPVLPKGATIYFKNDPNYPFLNNEWGKSTKQASLMLNGGDALQLLYYDPTLNVLYEDSDTLPTISEKVYQIIAKIY